MPETDEPTPQDREHKEARRAQWALNVLVVFSAFAGSVFFAYVLYSIRPFSPDEVPSVEGPTSSVGERVGLLSSVDEETGLAVTLRDVDNAPGYRRELSEVMRNGMGIESPGRIYLLIVRNLGEEEYDVNLRSLTVSAGGESWAVRWVGDVAEDSNASAAGRMRIAQSESRFTLAPGAERQLYVHASAGAGGAAPAAEEFSGGELSLESGAVIGLAHEEQRLVEP